MSIQSEIAKLLETLKGNNEALYPYLANMSREFNAEKDFVYYAGPYWNEAEVSAAIESLLSGYWLSSGENVNRFERGFSRAFNFTDSVMVNSGSSANLVMIAALKKYLDWQDGDEIIVSAVGFPTTVSTIIQNGLKPVFVDISWTDLNWDITEIEARISTRTRAIFSSPVLGNPYNFDRVLDICNSHNLELISDNCDSLGSKWRGKYLTDYSIAASCSFYPAHHISTMEGGMVSSNNTKIVELARSFAWWGRACYCVGRQNLLSNGTCKKRFHKWIPDSEIIVDHKYVFENIGYNLKPLDLQGAIGNVQLEKFSEIELTRRKNKFRMDEIFRKIPGCRVIHESTNAETSWFGAPIVCESDGLKRSLVKYLEENRIQTRNYFAGNLLMQPGYGHLGDWRDYPNASDVLGKVFFVGVSPTISDPMLDYVESVVNRFGS
jgi:CDP-6-deoxy-D-xylo-4-hexulose-3-dehydrase